MMNPHIEADTTERLSTQAICRVRKRTPSSNRKGWIAFAFWPGLTSTAQHP